MLGGLIGIAIAGAILHFGLGFDLARFLTESVLETQTRPTASRDTESHPQSVSEPTDAELSPSNAELTDAEQTPQQPDTEEKRAKVRSSISTLDHRDASILALSDLYCPGVTHISDDGTVAVGVMGDRVFRWTSEAGQEFLDLPGASRASDVSANGSVIVGSCNRKMTPRGNAVTSYNAFIWRLAKAPLVFDDMRLSRCEAVTRDGLVVVLRANGEAYRWSEVTGVEKIGSFFITDISDDGKAIVGCRLKSGPRSDTKKSHSVSSEAILWTAETGVVGLGDLPGGVGRYPDGEHSVPMAISGDGSVVVGYSESSNGSEAFRWSKSQGMAPLGVLPGKRGSIAYDVSHDGNRVVGLSEDVAVIWDADDGMRRLSEAVAASGWDLQKASWISDDGTKVIAYGNSPASEATHWLVRLGEGDLTGQLPLDVVATGVDAIKSPNVDELKKTSPSLATTTSPVEKDVTIDLADRVEITDATTSRGPLTRTIETWASASSFSPDTSMLATAGHDSTVKLWDLDTGKLRATLRGHHGPVYSVKFSPTGDFLAAAGRGGRIIVWEWPTREQKMAISAHEPTARTVAWSSDGRALVSGGDDSRIYVWKIPSGELDRILLGHSAFVRSVAVDPKGRFIASSSNDGTIRLWNTSTGQPIGAFQGHSSYVYSVAVSPDGGIVASASEDGTARLWSVLKQSSLGTLRTPSGATHCVAFSPDGKFLATANADKSIRLWRTSTRRQFALLKGHTEVVWSVEISPDGEFVASTSPDKTVRIWKASPE